MNNKTKEELIPLFIAFLNEKGIKTTHSLNLEIINHALNYYSQVAQTDTDAEICNQIWEIYDNLRDSMEKIIKSRFAHIQGEYFTFIYISQEFTIRVNEEFF